MEHHITTENWKEEFNFRFGEKFYDKVMSYEQAQIIVFIESLLQAQQQKFREILEYAKTSFESIIKNDKTPKYQYGEGQKAKNARGEIPGLAERWMTPREIAEEALSQLDQSNK